MSLRLPSNTVESKNPLDLIEEIVGANEWPFDRASRDELAVELDGQWCGYRLFFFWQPDLSAMHFSCMLDMRVPAKQAAAVHSLLALMNERLWLGHFDVCSEDGTPMFRHTMLMRGAGRASVEQIEDLVDVAITECERFYPAFQFVIWGGKSAREAIDASLLDVMGEA